MRERPIDRIGYPPPLGALGKGPPDDFVFDVRDIPAEQDLGSGVLQPPVQDIEVHLGPDLSHVRREDHGGTAEINRNHSRNSRDEITDGTTMRIVKAKTHLAEGKRLIRSLSIGSSGPDPAHRGIRIVRRAEEGIAGTTAGAGRPAALRRR